MATLIMKSTSKWRVRDYRLFSIDSTSTIRNVRNGNLPKSWLRFPDRDDGVDNPIQPTPAETIIINHLFGKETTGILCSPNSSIGLMLDGFIAHHAPPRSAAFFVDLGRVMARNIGAILTLKSSLLQSDQLAIPEPGPEPETQRPNHPRPETPSPPVPDKRIRIASISTDAGTIFDWSSPFKSSPLNTESEASSSFKESSSVVEEDDDAGQDHAHCETVTQAMLLSFLQAISNARYDPTSTSRRFAFSFVPDHHRIDVDGLHGSSGPTKFSSINDGSLVARIKTGTYTRDGLQAGTFTTYERDPNMIFCILECKRVSEGNTTNFPQKAGEILAAMYERVHHLFHFADGVKAEAFIDALSWAERTMFLISAEQSRVHFLQATFTPAYLKQMLGYQMGTRLEELEVLVSPEFNLVIPSHRTEAAELVAKLLGLLESEWAAFFEKKGRA